MSETPKPEDTTVLKGVILAGGTGSRLFPLTKVTNKHLLPVGREPMIIHPIKKLLNAGVRDILIVTGTEHMGAVVQLLGSGREYGGRFTYKVQDEAGGIAQALGLAEDFIGINRMVVILGDNMFEASLNAEVDAFAKQDQGARILIKEVPDPERYGVAELDGDKIVSIEEKPKAPKRATAPEALPGSGSEQYSPALVVDGSRVHVVWEDKALGDAELFLSTLDAGQWSTPSNLSQTASHSNRPSVIVDAGGVLHVAWHEAFNGTEQIQHRQQR